MNTSRTAVVGLLLTLALGIPGSAAGQQDKDQQGCINFLNKGFAKISSTQFKAIAKCVSTYAKDDAATLEEACILDSTKVSDAEEKVNDGALGKCSTPPTIGPAIASDVTNEARFGAIYLAGALLGSLTSDLVKCSDVPVDDGCKCQNTVLKTTAKLSDFYLKSFNKCKKNGLKAEGAEQIVDNAGLLACIIDPAKLDPKAKYAKLIEKSKSAIGKGCSALVTNPLPHSFECTGLTGDALAICIDVRTRCYMCVGINSADHLDSHSSCDTFDDGTDNSSCHGS